MDEVSEWIGREVFDAGAKRIGTIIGLGYARRKFGTTWLLVDAGGAQAVLVPADQMSCAGDRLVLPYPKAYVERAPGVEQGRPLSPEEERRLRLHYGLDSGSLNTGCSAGCGMCMANRRDRRRRGALEHLDRPPLAAEMFADVSGVSRKWLDIPYASVSPAQRLDLYLPAEGDGPFPVLLRIHGGAFEMGDKRDIQFLPFLRGVERGYAVASVNYRLSGEALFPAAVRDVKAAVRWLRANATRYSLDPVRIAASGESAGGYLAAMVAVTAEVDTFDDASLGNAGYPSGVQAAVDWFGPIDFFTMDEQRDANGLGLPDLGPGAGAAAGAGSSGPPSSPETKFLGAPIAEVPDLVRAANPATYVHAGMPPILIQHGRFDPLVPFQQSVEFVKAIEERAGAGRYELDILEGAGHGGPEFETDANMDRMFGFVDRFLLTER
jgi:acetyl esterase/lipase